MKTLTILLAFLISFFSDEIDCESLKNGKFRTENKDGSLTVITREGNRQTEDYNNGERVSEFDVKWSSECEYLVFNRRVIKGNDPWPEMNSDTLKVLIVEIQDGFYFTESEMLSRGWKMNQKVEVLKNK